MVWRSLDSPCREQVRSAPFQVMMGRAPSIAMSVLASADGRLVGTSTGRMGLEYQGLCRSNCKYWRLYTRMHSYEGIRERDERAKPQLLSGSPRCQKAARLFPTWTGPWRAGIFRTYLVLPPCLY